MLSRRQFHQATWASAAASFLSPTWLASHVLGASVDDTVSGSQPSRSHASGIGRNAAATVHPLATSAAIDCYRLGGNAIDAAVAAALCLGVVDGHNSGIGGGCLILVRSNTGELHAIDGRETAPAAVRPDLYLRDGKPSVELSQTGPHAVAVPSQVAALHTLHQKHGLLAWTSLFDAAIDAAENGYTVRRATHDSIASEAADLKRFDASRSTLLKADGSPYAVGEILRQKDLARTLKQIAAEGPDWFYRGEFAHRCVGYLQSLGGVMALDDLNGYRPVHRPCIESSYRDFRIIGFPPPSSGGIHIAQMLNMLASFDVRAIYHESPAKYYHLIAECMKRAFADRAHWLGDTDFVQVPQFLTDTSYAKSLAKQIDMDRASDVSGFGTVQGFNDDSKKHTTHLATADAAGNWVALTSTVNTGWGSKVMVPGTGVMLNNQMDDFSIAPGIPNAFGLIGSQRNSIEPRKRPLSSMSPTIVLNQDGSPCFSCGAAGGPKIINATLQIILGCIDLQLEIHESIERPRIHHQWRPDQLLVEESFGGATAKDRVLPDLDRMGHSTKRIKSIAIAQGIQATAGGLLAACDPRADGSAQTDSAH